MADKRIAIEIKLEGARDVSAVLKRIEEANKKLIKTEKDAINVHKKAQKALNDQAIAEERLKREKIKTTNASKAQNVASLRGVTALEKEKRQLLMTAAAQERLKAATLRTSHAQNGLTNSFIKGNLAARAISMAFNSISQAMRYAITAGVEFEFSIAKLSAITGGSTESVNGLRDAIIEVSLGSPKTATEVSGAALAMSKLGLSAKDTAKALKAVVDLSTVMDESVESVGETMTTVKNVFNLSANDLNHVAESLFSTFSGSALSLDKFRVAFGFAGAGASMAGASMEETAAAMGALANAGIRASSIGTGLRTIFTNLSIEGSKASKLIGGKTIQDIGLSASLLLLEKRLKDTSALKDAFGKPALSVIQNLVKMRKEYELLKDDAINAQDGLNNAVDEMMDSTKGKMAALKSSFEVLGIAIMEAISPVTKTLLSTLTELLNGFTKSGRGSNFLESMKGSISSEGLESKREELKLLREKIVSMREIDSSNQKEIDFYLDKQRSLSEVIRQEEKRIKNSKIQLGIDVLDRRLNNKSTLDIMSKQTAGMISASKTMSVSEMMDLKDRLKDLLRQGVEIPLPKFVDSGSSGGSGGGVATNYVDLLRGLSEEFDHASLSAKVFGNELESSKIEKYKKDLLDLYNSIPKGEENFKDKISVLKELESLMPNEQKVPKVDALTSLQSQYGLADARSSVRGESPDTNELRKRADALKSVAIAMDKAGDPKAADAYRATAAAIKDVDSSLRDAYPAAFALKDQFDGMKSQVSIANGLVDSFSRLSDAMIDAAVEGKNLGDVMKGVLKQLLVDLAKTLVKMAIMAIVMKAFGPAGESASIAKAVLSGGGLPLSKNAKGFKGIVSEPTMFLAGESGKEIVNVTPRAKVGNNNDNQGGMTVVVQGSIIDRDGFMNAVQQSNERIGRRYLKSV